MKLRDWLKASNVSIKSFAEELQVERAMVYRYFTGAMSRANTIRRIELLTDGAVTAQDFYDNAMEHRTGGAEYRNKASDAILAAAALDPALVTVESNLRDFDERSRERGAQLFSPGL